MATMSSTIIVFGMLLTLLGLAGYFLTGASSPTALIPAIFGVLLLVLGFLARSEATRKHAMHAAATVALVGCGGAAVQPDAHARRAALSNSGLFTSCHGGADSRVRGVVRQVFHRRPARARGEALRAGVLWALTPEIS